jgi:hypothetical protein
MKNYVQVTALALLFLSLPPLVAVAQGGPMQASELDQTLSAAPLTRENVSRAVQVFSDMLGLSQTAFAENQRKRLVDAELAARTEGQHLISEEKLADVFTHLMSVVHAPSWAHASAADVKELRSGLRMSMPHLVCDDTGQLRAKLTPLESLYILHILSINGGLVRNKEQRSQLSLPKTIVVQSQPAFLTDTRRQEFGQFRTTFLDNTPSTSLDKLGLSIFELLQIPE